MKVIDLLERFNEYEYVQIHARFDMDWDDENPYTPTPARVKELGWLFVRSVSLREVEEITSGDMEKDGARDTCVVIVYR